MPSKALYPTMKRHEIGSRQSRRFLGCDDGISSSSPSTITTPSHSHYGRPLFLHWLPDRLPGGELSLDQGNLNESRAVRTSRNLDSAGPGTPDGYNTYPKPREESRPLDVATPTIPHVEINAEACSKGMGSRERGSGSRHQLHDCGYGAAEIQHRGMSDRAILRLFSGA